YAGRPIGLGEMSGWESIRQCLMEPCSGPPSPRACLRRDEIEASSAQPARQRARRGSEDSFEEASEVRLIRKAGSLRDIGERRLRRLEQATRALQPQRQQVLMRRAPHRLLECAREMCRREGDFPGEPLEG